MPSHDKSGTGMTCRGTVEIQLFVLWAFALAAVGVISGGCTSSDISSPELDALYKEVQTRGLIVGLEGLQPFSGSRADHAVGIVGEELGLAHSATSGNYLVHMPIIEQANSRGWPIYLLGYSLGGDQARRLAEACNERGITIRILFLLDPYYMSGGIPGRVPSNVRRVVFYTSRSYDDAIAVVATPDNLADAKQTALLVEDLQATEHMGLPAYVTQRIQAEIARDLQQAKVSPPTTVPPENSVRLSRQVLAPLVAKGG